MRESIEDKVTLEIVYEGRTHNAEDSDPKGMGVAFADVFSNYNLQERLALLGFGSRDAYLQAQPIIAAKAKDMVALNWSISSPMVSRRQVVVTSDEPF
jgi:type I restriction enzyme R subunit